METRRIESSHLTRLHETDRAGWHEQLGLQDGLPRNDLKLQTLRVCVVAELRLKGRDPPIDRYAHDVSTAAFDLGCALAGCSEFVP